MDRKKTIEIIVAIIIILALVIFLIWFFIPKDNQNKVITNDSEIAQDVPPPTPLVTQQQVEEKNNNPEIIARIFAERLGSFSNQGEYQNLTVIKEISTQSLQDRLEKIMNDALENDTGVYYGISTRVISIQEIEKNDKVASYNLTTQREEAIGDPGNATVRYQDIEVDLKKVDDNWLVSGFTWK
ncbi:hypothetical protein D6827_01130 [Candidatus Parcubacteria bacterium]|nr:MAG: hypothetical protein D6827_01130 [Candidatus Parcubacteria bacterium]